jgi:outer membrane protein OmpA-like peptidoglycan-associated protein
MRGLALMTMLAALAAVPAPASAQADPCAGVLDPSRIIDCLRPGGISGTTRGIRPSGGAAAVPSAPPATAAAQRMATPMAAPAAPAPAASSVDLNVPFAFDSAEMTPQGIAALGALATALKDPALSGAKFRIAGHTDARGTDAYNQALSERRAEAARRYLVEQGSVDPSRLSAVGFGRRQLYDVANPSAASNRRVQVIRIEN